MVNGALSNSAQVTVVTASTTDSKGVVTPTPIAGVVLSGPAGIAVDGASDLFIADTGNNRIVAVPYTSQGLNVSAATAPSTSLSGPLAVIVTPAGNLYVANSGVGQIEEIFYPLYQSAQQLVAVGFGNPTGLAIDASGSLFVADQGNSDIVRIPNVSGSLEPNDEVEAGIGAGGALRRSTGPVWGTSMSPTARGLRLT